VKRLADGVAGLRFPRVVYADVDGTLLGPGGSLFAMPGAGISLSAAAAVHALHAAGVELVLLSGRSRRGLSEPARLLGAGAYIAELGALVVDRRGPEEIVVRSFGSYRGDDSPYAEILRSGAGAYLLERFDGRLEAHPPWSRHPREVTVLLRGHVDPEEATSALAKAGYGWLELQDNGRLAGPARTLGLSEAHAYHLTPRGIAKAVGIRLHLERRGIPPDRAAVIGDSPADLRAGAVVGAAFCVANGVDAVAAHAPENAWATSAGYGDGFAEAVGALLAAADDAVDA
jgi:hydroxymethylpyrimidine pyrophosphatase-like HAD family hydrolase